MKKGLGLSEGLPRDMRRYLEGYCRIPIASLHRAFDKGQGTLVWRDQTGAMVGSAMVTARFDGVMRVAFDISGSDNVEAYLGEVAISLVSLPAGLHRREPYAVCPACQTPAKILIAKDHRWHCGTCHGLMNRSALLRTNIRLTEQVALLEGRVGSGRPMGMHNATYEREVRRLQDAKLRLGDAALSADRRYIHVVDHHVAGERIKVAKRPVVWLKHLADDRLFTGSLLERLNLIFNEGAYHCTKHLARSRISVSDLAVEDAIVQAVKIRPLVLGIPDEVSDSAEWGGLARTVVEVPFLGDADWLRVGSERGKPLPPIVGQIDADASVVRFSWNGSVIDRPALRVQINETLAVLREHIARQEAAIAMYHASLKSEARRYMQTQIWKQL